MKIVTVHKAKTELSKLIAEAEAGEDIVIARRDKPAVRLVPYRLRSEQPPAGLEIWEHAPDDYISKEDIAAYYRRFPQEWDEMIERVGFGEDKQADYDASGIREAVATGQEFVIMRGGKPVAKVVPVETGNVRTPGRFSHMRGNLPPDLFDQPLDEEELAAWRGEKPGKQGR